MKSRLGRTGGKQRDGAKVHKGRQTTTATYILLLFAVRHEGGRGMHGMTKDLIG